MIYRTLRKKKRRIYEFNQNNFKVYFDSFEREDSDAFFQAQEIFLVHGKENSKLLKTDQIRTRRIPKSRAICYEVRQLAHQRFYFEIGKETNIALENSKKRKRIPLFQCINLH